MSDESDTPKKGASVAVVVAGAVLVYFVPITVVLFDELVFHTFYASRYAPEWFVRAFRVIYLPFFWWFDR